MIREKVRFIRGNILQHGFLESLGRYDVVFCRNVLIYFNKDGQKQAINSLYNLLVPEGLLFTGHAEASLFMESRFVPVMHSKSFAFYKSKEMPEQADTHAQSETKARPETKPAEVPEQFQRSRPQGVKSSSHPLSTHKEDEFALTRKLADEGHLEEAAGRSEKYLRQSGPSARWYYLLGIIRDSQGRSDEALKLLRKAVYLDPADVESLVQLSLITERAGDFTTAANYKRRAKKIRESEEHL
jgi:chemotaxis protein methyltransferase WspC